MVPESVATLYGFLALVAPGLVYQLLRERARPALEESAFREASRVALSSIVFSTASLLTVALTSQLWPHWFVNGPAWIERGNAYLAENLALVARTILSALLLAFLYALLTHFAVERWRRRAGQGVVKTDVWYQLLVEDVPRGTVPWVVLTMSDGTYLWGHVHFFTVGKSLADRDISLTGPKLSMETAGRPQSEEYWQRISVKVADVSIMKVAYEPKAHKLRKPRWIRRRPDGEVSGTHRESESGPTAPEVP